MVDYYTVIVLVILAFGALIAAYNISRQAEERKRKELIEHLKAFHANHNRLVKRTNTKTPEHPKSHT